MNVRIARQACWLVNCKVLLDAIGHHGVFVILYLI